MEEKKNQQPSRYKIRTITEKIEWHEKQLKHAEEWYPYFEEKTRTQVRQDPKWKKGREIEMNYHKRKIEEYKTELGHGAE